MYNGDQQGGRTTKRTAAIDKHKSEWTQNVAKDMSVVQVRFEVRVWAVCAIDIENDLAIDRTWREKEEENREVQTGIGQEGRYS